MATYYQRGAMFENLLIAALTKRQLHAYQKADFYFWRDNNDLEVDLLWEGMGKLRIAEIKSSETVHDNFFTNMHKFAKNAEPTAVVPFLFYGGALRHLSIWAPKFWAGARHIGSWKKKSDKQKR